MSAGLVVDIVIFGLIALFILVNATYGICLLIRWIWKKLRKKKNGHTI